MNAATKRQSHLSRTRLVRTWLLFRSRWPLWTALALVQVAVLSALRMPEQRHSATHALLAAWPVAPFWSRLADWGEIALLAAGALAINHVMTALANRVVRGEGVRVADLFHMDGVGKTSAALLVTCAAVALGSLLLGVGGCLALALVLPLQSTVYRTHQVRMSLPAIGKAMRRDLARGTMIAAALLALFAFGVATAGLGLLVAIPIAKLMGAHADRFVEAQSLAQADRFVEAQSLAPPAAPAVPKNGAGLRAAAPSFLPPSPAFVWTPEETKLLDATYPALSPHHLVAAVIVILIAGALLLPSAPAAKSSVSAGDSSVSAGDSSVSARDASASTGDSSVSAPPPETDGQPPSVPDPPAPDPSASEPSSAPLPPFVERFGPGVIPALPCRLRWGDYVVQVETIPAAEASAYSQTRLSVMDPAGRPVYTVTDDQIAAITLAPLLQGNQPELMIRTEEDGDQTRGMDVALTQQGGVSDLYVVRNAIAVQALTSGDAGPEPVVVHAAVVGADLPVRGGPVLTATYRWNGYAYENAVRTIPGPTQARMDAYGDALQTPEVAADPNQAGLDNVGFLVNAQDLGLTDLPEAVTNSDGCRQGEYWLEARPETQAAMRAQVVQSEENLPRAAGREITGRSTDQAFSN